LKYTKSPTQNKFILKKPTMWETCCKRDILWVRAY